ncbi:hypothetical protein CsSME_00025045 [Camellia sinensis var. sinensis]
MSYSNLERVWNGTKIIKNPLSQSFSSPHQYT